MFRLTARALVPTIAGALLERGVVPDVLSISGVMPNDRPTLPPEAAHYARPRDLPVLVILAIGTSVSAAVAPAVISTRPMARGPTPARMRDGG